MIGTEKTLLEKNRLWPLLIILAGALVVRLILIYYCGMMYSMGDEMEYLERALFVHSGYGFQQIMRPPIYHHFIALLFWVFGLHLIVIGWANIVFHLGSVTMLYLIGRDLYGRAIALWAAAIYAFFPPFVMFVQYGLPINMAVFLYLPALWFLVRFERGGRARLSAWAGFFVGISALTYESMIISVPAFIIGLFIICKKGKMKIFTPLALFLVVLSLTVGVWTARNYILTRHFFLISINYGNYSWRAHNTLIHLGHDYRIWEIVEEANFYPQWDVEYAEGRRGTNLKTWQRAVGPDPVENARQDLRNAIRFVMDHPLLTLRRCGPKLSVLWSPTPFAAHFLMMGYYGLLDPTTIRGIVLLCVVSFTMLVLTGVVGMTFSPFSGSKITFILLIVVWSIFYSLMHPMTRYRPPFIPILALYAAYAICHRRLILALKGNRWRWAIVGSLVLLFLVLWTPHIRILDNIFRDPFPKPKPQYRRSEVDEYLKHSLSRQMSEYQSWGGWRETGQSDNL